MTDSDARSDWTRFTELLDQAFELPEEARDAWIAALTGDDARHRARLAEWLALDASSEGFLERPIPPGATWDRDAWLPCAPGERIGPYRVVRTVGIGASSIVYEADGPTEVALKVFQADLADESARRRFLDEARILTELEHPNIAAIVDVGQHAFDGHERPWIAMELVRGARSVTRYAAERDLSQAERIELAVQLGEAVAHGHRRGVVHRDLKPANVLVDENGALRVIDFGIAKVVRDDGVDATRTGSLVGTLGWMSPEQLRGDANAVDTRSDVYAIGVLLHQLVTGAPPHDLSHASLETAIRLVCDTPIPVPRIDGRRVDRDLAAILQVALCKDPDGRYAGAAELVADLRRYLARQPVIARPPSLVHHLRLRMSRHRAIAATTIAATLALAVAIGAGERRARRVAADERAKTAAITEFLTSVLEFGSPTRAPRSDLTMREVLDDASRRIEADLAGAPGARAEVHAIVGSAWRELGDPERAEEHMRAAVDELRELRPGTWELASTLSILSEVLLSEGRAREAIGVLTEARELYSGLPDVEGFYLAIVGNKLAGAHRLLGEFDVAEALCRDAIAEYRRAFGEEHVATASGLDTLAKILLGAGRLEEAEVAAREALRIHVATTGDGGMYAAKARASLADVLIALGRREAARGLLLRAEATFDAALPDGHPDRLKLAEALREVDG